MNAAASIPAHAASESSVESLAQSRPRARSMLFDLFGDFADEGGRGGAIRLGAMVRLAADLGASASATRSAANRMVQDGWLVAERQGRESVYALSARGRQLIEQGRRRIFAPPEAAWDGCWYLVALSVPESHREVRDRMRRELSWLGFGSPSSALYVSPHDHSAEVSRLAEELGATGYVQIYRAEALWPADPRELVARAWGNLAEVNRRYAAFVGRFGPLLPVLRERVQAGTLDDRAAFRIRFTLVNQFRKCLFDDPDLPSNLLPVSWQGTAARKLFLALHDLLAPQALRYFDRVCAASSGRRRAAGMPGRAALARRRPRRAAAAGRVQGA